MFEITTDDDGVSYARFQGKSRYVFHAQASPDGSLIHINTPGLKMEEMGLDRQTAGHLGRLLLAYEQHGTLDALVAIGPKADQDVRDRMDDLEDDLKRIDDAADLFDGRLCLSDTAVMGLSSRVAAVEASLKLIEAGWASGAMAAMEPHLGDKAPPWMRRPSQDTPMVNGRTLAELAADALSPR